MTISRITTWADGNTLSAAPLNAEFDNIINAANNGTLVSVGGIVPYVNGLTGTIISNTASFAAQGYTMRTTASAFTNVAVTATSSFSINTQTAGPAANGRDQAGAFASTTVHFYAISTGLNSTAPKGLCSSTPPPNGPTMPTGYSAWSYLASAIYTVASSAATLQLRVSGNTCYFSTRPSITSGIATSSEREVSLGARVPAMAQHVLIQGGLVLTGTGANTFVYGGLGAGADQSPTVYPVSFTLSGRTDSTGIFQLIGDGPLPIPIAATSPTVFVAVTPNTTGMTYSASLQVINYRVPNGDV